MTIYHIAIYYHITIITTIHLLLFIIFGNL